MKKGIALLVLIISLVGMSGVVSAAPIITDWFSTGGTTINKDNDKDIMYLIQQGDSITFSIIASGATSYKWLINKVDQNVNANMFVWTVPSEKDIWEIRAEASDVTGTVPKEWIISTLSVTEAPVFFEYYSDGKYNSRSETDPWGRPLPEWINRKGTVDISNCNFGSSSMYTMMDAPLTTVYGTWEYQFRFSEGGADYALDVGVHPIMNNSWDGNDYTQNSYRVLKAADEHLWLDYLDNNSGRYPIAYSTPAMGGSGYYCIDDGCGGGGSIGIGRDWHTIRIIHDTDGIWYVWLDDDYVPYSSHWMDVEDISTAIGLSLVQPDARRVWIDNVRVYDTVIFPDIKNTYDSGSNTVIVKGYDNTLSSIASDIDDEGIFTYNSGTKIAACNANLQIARGAQLLLNDETLIFNILDPFIEMKPGWILEMNNSTITTSGSGNILHYRSAREGHSDYINGWTITGATMGKLVMYNSAIENINKMLLPDLRHADIQNSNFLVLGDHAIRPNPTSYRDYYLVKNNTFTAGNPIGAHTYTEWDGIVYDTILNNGNMVVRGAQHFVNTKFNFVTVGDYWAQKRIYQYYLDVKVVDSNGNPVPDATVTVTNEIDSGYPAENMKTGWQWTHPTSGQVVNWYRQWIDANNLVSTTTGSNGHTPLPSDGDNTIIISDYLMNKETTGTGSAVQTSFTYTITAEKDGYIETVTGINPDETWYRSDSDTYQNTITIILPMSITPPAITIQSPQPTSYPNKFIPLNFSSNEQLQTCLLSVDSTINQTLENCQNQSTINKEYQSTLGELALWHFNGNVLDSIANNHGTINGATFTNGKFGQGLSFNGISDYIEIPDALDGGNQITIEAWVKPITGTRGSIIAKYYYDYTTPINEKVYELDVAADGTVNFALSSDGASAVWLASSQTVNNNEWNHIVATSDGTTMKIYINGQQDTNTATAPATIHNSPYGLQIGAWNYSEITHYFNGIIDEVRILDRALTQEEIESDYGLPTGSHLLTLYVNDTSGNANSESVSFTVQELLPPTIQLTSIAQDTSAPYYSATSIPRANFTTDVTASCRIALTDLAYDAMTTDCDVGQNTLIHSCRSPTIADGTHILYLACTDGTTSHTAANNYEASVIVDTTKPEVIIDVPINNTEISGPITLTATATDTNGVDIVEFYLLDSSYNPIDPITCAPSSGLIGTANKAGNIFTLAWTVSNCPGNHWIVARAYDPAENYILNYSYVTIPETTCTENWECDPEWGECISGVQTRNCWDNNNCGTTENKPAETATCGANKNYYLQVTGTIECT